MRGRAPNRAGRLLETASQTAGPFVHIGCLPNDVGVEMWGGRNPGRDMASPGVRGEPVVLRGRVFDGLEAPVRDAVVEFWQADAAGLYPSQAEGRGDADPKFFGWARRGCDEEGSWSLETIKPGPTPHPSGRLQAPHIAMWIVARGVNIGLLTRIYFDGDPLNAQDPVLTRVDPPVRARTLLAVRDGDHWRFDVRLQGESETVFFDG